MIETVASVGLPIDEKLMIQKKPPDYTKGTQRR